MGWAWSLGIAGAFDLGLACCLLFVEYMTGAALSSFVYGLLIIGAAAELIALLLEAREAYCRSHP